MVSCLRYSYLTIAIPMGHLRVLLFVIPLLFFNRKCIVDSGYMLLGVYIFLVKREHIAGSRNRLFVWKFSLCKERTLGAHICVARSMYLAKRKIPLIQWGGCGEKGCRQGIGKVDDTVFVRELPGS